MTASTIAHLYRFEIMIFNQGRTFVMLFSAGIVCLFMIYSFGRDERTATLSLPPIKTRGSRHIAKKDFEENGDSKGILFSTDIYCNTWQLNV